MRHNSTKSGVLQIVDLSIERGDKHLVSGLTLTVNPGDIVWVKGDNGIGKTSLLLAIAGLLRPDNGEILWDGEKICHTLGFAVLQGHLDSHKRDLTAQENLEFWQTIYGGETSIDCILKRVDLRAQRDLRVKNFSAGQSRRLALARLVMSKAPLWVLDEPAAAMDAKGRELIHSLLQEHIGNKGSAILASHGAPDRIGGNTRVLTLNKNDSQSRPPS